MSARQEFRRCLEDTGLKIERAQTELDRLTKGRRMQRLKGQRRCRPEVANKNRPRIKVIPVGISQSSNYYVRNVGYRVKSV